MAKSFHRFAEPYKTGLVICLGEFCGTFMFLLLSFMGAQAALDNNPASSGRLDPSTLLYIASSFGTALAVNVWVFYRVSGGMFNPAVTLGLVLVGAVKPLRALIIVPSQFAAGIAAAAVVSGLLPGHLDVTNSLGSDTSIVQGLFIEMFLTAQLVLTVYFLAVEKHRATFLAPVGIGASVFVAHIAGTNFTGTGINPARSLGPAAVIGSFRGYHWIYWLGPCLGALLSFGVYSLLKVLEYQVANPGQDAGDPETANEEAIAAAEMGQEGLAMVRSRSRSESAPSEMKLKRESAMMRRTSAADGTPTSAADAV
ncbi:aquaporin [Trichoderma cornu-damae]|uniref:Aquaporin n=1 Tax=Trichoderma cornu-damae TaxID=654480 RepID=A0A9P8QKQ3_9HYPO|nr:aquaporin [Trichoderma cornu-damae]